MTVTIQTITGASASTGGVTTIASGNLSTGSPSTIDITSIPATYRGLRLTIRSASNTVATRALRINVDNGLGTGNAGNDSVSFMNGGNATLVDQNLFSDVTQTAAQLTHVVVEFSGGYASASAMQYYSGIVAQAETSADTFTSGTGPKEFHGVLATTGVSRFGAIVGIRITWDNVATGVFDGGTYLLEGFN